MHRFTFAFLGVVLFLATFAGCQTANESDAVPPESSISNGGEPLEGRMTEPSGLSSNPARPQTERPAPAPGP